MTASMNISSCFENPQSALISAFKQRDVDSFIWALEYARADPNIVDPRIEMTIFEKILMTPDSSEFIFLCINNGADLYTKNLRNRYPIHYAVDSLCPDNLIMFLKYYDQRKINVRYGNKNCLHILTELLTNDNCERVSECIKILVRHGCDVNMPNEKSRTPFFNFLQIQKRLTVPNDLMAFFLDNANIDLYTYKADEMKKKFQEQNPNLKLPDKVEKVVDSDFMLSLLRAGKEAEFEVNFKHFKDISKKTQIADATEENESNRYAEDCARFIYAAVQNDLENAVDLLISDGIDVNKKPQDAKCKRPPVFLACASGYYRIVDLLLRANPKPDTTYNGKNLLHEVCHHFGTENNDNKSINYQKCFELVVDHCVDVNEKDNQGCTPLHYAVRYRNDEAIKCLLEKSCYIGAKNGFGETAIDDINREVFENFLDSCVTANVKRTGEEEHEVTIDFNFLMAPKGLKREDEFRQEIAPLQNIADNSELRPLILHPVLSSFLYLKWSKLRLLFYGNFLLFSIFMLSLIVYIVLCQSIPAAQRNDSSAYCFFYILSMISLILLMLREIFQGILSLHNYMKSPMNWFEIILIILGWTVLLQSNDKDPDDYQRIIRAVTILFAAYEFLQLVGTLPILSISTHMVILKKVATTFLKSIALYSILLLAFAMTFFTLFGKKNEEKMMEEAAVKSKAGKDSDCCKQDDDNDADEFNSFGYPGIAIIKTFVMLTGEFDASSLDLDRNGISYCIIFLLFVFLVTIVLFNLLNALAVDDTQVIKAEGQLVDLCQRISVLNKYEKIILSRSSSWRWLKSIISIFPHTIPNGKIVIRPNRSNEILTLKARQSSRDVSIKIEEGQEQELHTLNNNSSLEKIIPTLRISQKLEKYSAMDPKIMKAIRRVLEQRNENKLRDEKEEALWKLCRKMESQLKILSDFVMKNKS